MHTDYILPPVVLRALRRIQDTFEPPPSPRQIQCKRCLRTFPYRPRLITEDGVCASRKECDAELRARLREWRAIDREESLRENKGVAEGNIQAHNGGVPTGTGQVEVHMARPSHQIVEEHFTSEAARVARARELLNQGLKAWEVTRRVGLGSGTVQRLATDPTYTPDFRIMEIRRKQFQDKRIREGRANPQDVKERPELQQAVSLRERILAALRADPGRGFSPLELRAAITRPGENIDLHNIIHVVVDGLRKQGLVKADERHQGKETLWFNIRLAGAGYKANATASAPPPPLPQPARAPARPEPAPNSAAVAPAPTPAPSRPLAQNQRPLGADYPLLRQLVGRRGKVAMAAGLLREAGLTDEADLVMGSVKISALEEEVLKLVEEFKINF